MRVVATRADLASARAELSGRVAVVMTMGALHAGHAALVQEARSRADSVVATVFVNPLQFGTGEDLDRYPRTLDDDLALLEEHGADLVFTPTPDVVYPDGPPLVRISAGPLGEVLEGASRPWWLVCSATIRPWSSYWKRDQERGSSYAVLTKTLVPHGNSVSALGSPAGSKHGVPTRSNTTGSRG